MGTYKKWIMLILEKILTITAIMKNTFYILVINTIYSNTYLTLRVMPHNKMFLHSPLEMQFPSTCKILAIYHYMKT